MSAAFAPAAGSIADRALKHLQCFPLRTKLTASVIAQALGKKADGVLPSLEVLVKHKLVARVRTGGGATRGRYAYCLPYDDLVDEKPAVAAADDDADEQDAGGQPVRRIVPAAGTAAPRAGVPSVFALGASVGQAESSVVDEAPPAPAEKPPGLNWRPARPLVPALAAEPEAKAATPRPASAPALAAVAVDLDCALWSNGELWIKVPEADKPLVLSKAQTRALVHYLDNLAHEPILEAHAQ